MSLFRTLPGLLIASIAVGACKPTPPAQRGEADSTRRPAMRRDSARPTPATAAADPRARGDHLLLAVDWDEEGHTFGEAVAVLPAGGGYRPIPFADSLEAFYARWLDRGHRYTVLNFGRPAGTAVAGTNDAEGCAAAGAELDARGVTEAEWGSGLATDLAVAQGPPTRRPASPAEVAAMTALLRRAVAEHGGTWGSDADVRVTAIPLAGGRQVLAGSVEVGGDRENGDPPQAAAFVIAERAGDAYRPAIVWTPPDPTGGDEERARSRLLLDAVDLDGDGTAELVTRTGFSEWSQYTIYRRGPSGWTVAWEGSGGGC